LRDSSTSRFISINPVIRKVATRKTANRKKVADSWAGGKVLHRKKQSKARAERATDKRPGPKTPKSLLARIQAMADSEMTIGVGIRTELSTD
jgi:hypothetical protein